jgi:UTP--glucose-1-phosphate uridylyltransferase
MTKNVKKAIFPVAGFGTRFLPATKSIPKEMLTVVDRPVIQYAVDEAVQAGCDTLIFVTGRSKRAIEDYFDDSPELEFELGKKKDHKSLALVQSILPSHVQCIYIRQSRPLGLGHAVLCASSLIDEDETFAVVLPDDLIDGHDEGVLSQMIRNFPAGAQGMFAVEKVPNSELHRYGVIRPKQSCDGPMIEVDRLVEKPSQSLAPSNWAVVGRYLLKKSLMHALEHQTPGLGGEIQLTDALSKCSADSRYFGFVYDGLRFDCGSRVGFQQANLHYWNKLSHSATEGE